MALLKDHVHQVYINASLMDNAKNASMITSALVSAISVPIIFASVANHLNHAIQLLAMNAEMERACAVTILNAPRKIRMW